MVNITQSTIIFIMNERRYLNRKSYVVCAVQRSGSSFLCELLKSTGIAGMPEEYFLYEDEGEYLEAGWWAQSFGVTKREEYLPLVLKKGRTGNGVFGTKMMWNYFIPVMEALAELPAYEGLSQFEQMAVMVDKPKYIWIVRKDKVRQAVSWAIAAQTDIYATSQGNLADHIDRLQFDYEQIRLLHGLVREGEAGWRAYFAENNIRPYKSIVHEGEQPQN